MSRFRHLIFVSILAFSFVQLMGETVSGQLHGGGCSCAFCSGQQLSGEPSSAAALKLLSTDSDVTSFGTSSFGSKSSGSNSSGISSFSPIQQTVFLDFDTGTAGSVNYTQAIRNDIVSNLDTIYQDFGVTFLQAAPASGAFSTLQFNAGAVGGLADGIDFRNLNQSDNAVINASGLDDGSAASIAGFSANIAAHELGHLLGLRHRDAFGPIGSGVFAGTSGSFLPAFPGPTNATEFVDHVLSTPALGANIARFEDPIWFSERSAIKLAAISQLNVVNEVATNNDSIANAQALTLGQLVVPNTIITGQNSGIGDFDVDAISVTGSIDVGTDDDFYSFQGAAGDLFNFEVISSGNSNITDTVDSQISIFDANGVAVNYFGQAAFNDDEIETLDSVIIDLVLPTTGTFFIQVGNFGTSTGDYELFFTRFNGAVAVPEPASAGVLLIGLIACGLRRRRRDV